MTLTIGFKTDIGRSRELNQDSYAVLKRPTLYDELDALLVVADGMGGGRGGEVASSIVAQTIPEAIIEKLSERNGARRRVDPAALLRETIARANGSVWQRQVERSDLRGMGTTCVAAIVREEELTVGNVGDSRAYLLREGKLRQITDDHSEIWALVKAGEMSREEARKSRLRNRITRAIGIGTDVRPDIETLTLQEGDTILLCSDGLTTEVPDPEIARILATAPDAQSTCDRLVETALKNGGSDNITVVVARYGNFTPLALPDSVVVEEDEPVTDERQEWRQTTRLSDSLLAELEEPTSSRRSSRPLPELDDFPNEFEDDDPEEPSTGGGSSFATTGLIFLLVAVVALATALYFALTTRNVQINVLKPQIATPSTASTEPAPEEEPITEKDLDYSPEPVVVYKQPLRDAPMIVDEAGNVIAISQDGKKTLRINTKGEVSVLSTVNLGESAVPAAKQVYMTQDVSGNLYKTNPTEKTVEKFNYSGTRVKSNIAKGSLTAPTSIGVARNGNIYVIDNHILKKITASVTFERQQQERVERQRRTDSTP